MTLAAFSVPARAGGDFRTIAAPMPVPPSLTPLTGIAIGVQQALDAGQKPADDAKALGAAPQRPVSSAPQRDAIDRPLSFGPRRLPSLQSPRPLGTAAEAIAGLESWLVGIRGRHALALDVAVGIVEQHEKAQSARPHFDPDSINWDHASDEPPFSRPHFGQGFGHQMPPSF
ncbi:MAG: hypothetical protein KGO96_08205 [Elusimicrobia bacterium]|nr:hypothetical protein [Elusimicrobiota bacterium]